MRKRLIQFLSVALFLSLFAGTAYGDRYRDCQRRAESESGYYGRVPDRYLPGGALKGAMKGAAAGAAIGWIGGKKAGKKAKQGAALGALIGGIKRDKAKKKQKRKRRAYEFEMRMCMSRDNRY